MKFNVVALGGRDYYQVPLALKEKGILGKVITDFYTPDFLRKLLKKRFNEGVSSKYTSSLLFWVKIFKLLYQVFKWRKPGHDKTDYFFGFIAAFYTYLGSNKAIVYSYYLEGFVAFYKLLNKKPNSLIVFQVHPTPWHINNILKEDQRKHLEKGGAKYIEELEVNYGEREYLNYLNSLAFADKVICASEFTASSLYTYSIPIHIPVFVAPYGSRLSVNESLLLTRKNRTDKIRLITVCQIIQRKGIQYAFEAMKGLEEFFEWNIVANRIDGEIRKFTPKNVTYKQGLSDQELTEHFLNADLFVMPSLIEGFGLVYVESTSLGTPVVCTRNTGAADFIEDNKSGFIVEAGCVDSMRNCFERVLEEPQILDKMRISTLEVNKKLTWENFREHVNNAVMSKSYEEY